MPSQYPAWILFRNGKPSALCVTHRRMTCTDRELSAWLSSLHLNLFFGSLDFGFGSGSLAVASRKILITKFLSVLSGSLRALIRHFSRRDSGKSLMFNALL